MLGFVAGCGGGGGTPLDGFGSDDGRTALSAGRPELLPDQYIVVLKPGADARAFAERASRRLAVSVKHVYEHALRGFSFRGNARAADALARDPAVASVTADEQIELDGQNFPTGVDRIDAEQSALYPYNGSDQRVNVNVAILDSGINGTHPDLNFAGGDECVQDGWPYSADPYQHGTHVSGIVGALDNGIGVAGVAPGARLWSARVCDASGHCAWSDVICGVDWVTSTRTDTDTTNDIAVANMSLSGYGLNDDNCGLSNADALHTAICGSIDHGVVYVVAAGNANSDAASYKPASYPEVLTVSAIADSDGWPRGQGGSTGNGLDDTLATFSNWGAAVDIAAPGVDILSTVPGGYATASGTSMAAPHVTGAVVRYVAQHGASRDATGVAAIRQAITDPTQGYAIAQDDPKGFTADRDAYPEPLLLLGPRMPFDDRGIVWVKPVPSQVGIGETITFQLLVHTADAPGTITVVLRDAKDAITLGTQVASLGAWSTQPLSFTWTPGTGSSFGIHDIVAQASSASGEALANNATTAGVQVGRMHVGDIDLAIGSKQVTATVTAHLNNHAILSGVTVAGIFSCIDGSYQKSVSCKTGALGTCKVSASRCAPGATTPSGSFTIVSLNEPDLLYASSENHDPDGDTTGTTSYY